MMSKSETVALAKSAIAWLFFDRHLTNVCEGMFYSPEQLSHGQIERVDMVWNELAHLSCSPSNDAAADLVAENARLREACECAGVWFQEYADSHAEQGKTDKAARNQERANVCRAALATGASS